MQCLKAPVDLTSTLAIILAPGLNQFVHGLWRHVGRHGYHAIPARQPDLIIDSLADLPQKWGHFLPINPR